jgi:hypothetical protein
MPFTKASRVFCILTLSLLLTAGLAEAADMGFMLGNKQSRAAVIELHGENTVWPGGGKVYLLAPGETRQVTISCTPGERICYGAWINGNDRIAFGVGPDNDRDCRNCCSICAARAMATIELPPDGAVTPPRAPDSP